MCAEVQDESFLAEDIYCKLARLHCDLQVCIHDAKVMDFLTASSGVFETILDAEDGGDGTTIERVLSEMEGAESAEIVQHLLSQLYAKHEQQD
jgi:hypothetical protein